ncbi:unnamed protein product [Clonostachys byssicola]|uniref:Uncharacterized protein n=1 Tax=Clonostachys byssicola TaxID=160290 RepID=A0A9N9Y134_9HYPO|nr:unnamed protein product [Clonostachys byssicola]
MNLLLKICLRPNPPHNVFYALVEACQDAWAEQSESGTASWAFNGVVYSDLLRAAVQLGEFDFFEEVAKNRDMRDNVPLEFFTWVREWVGYDRKEAASRFEQIHAGLPYCLPSNFDDLFATIEAFAPLDKRSHNCLVAARFTYEVLWHRAQEPDPSHLSKSDGRAMVKCARYLAARSFLSEVAVQKLSQCYDDPEIIFGFLSQIKEDMIEGIRQPTIVIAAHTVAADLLINANPGEWQSSPVIESLFGKGSVEERSAVKSEDIAEFLSIFLEHNPEEYGLVLNFMENLIEALPDLQMRSLTSLWIPFLSALTRILTSNNIPFTDPVCQTLYLTFISKLVNDFVGHEPPELSDSLRGTKPFSVNTKVRKLWHKRRVEAVALLKSFDQSHLKSLLESKYDILFRMQHLIVAKPPPLQKQLKKLPGAANPSSTSPRRGAKRKAKKMN